MIMEGGPKMLLALESNLLVVFTDNTFSDLLFLLFFTSFGSPRPHVDAGGDVVFRAGRT